LFVQERMMGARAEGTIDKRRALGAKFGRYSQTFPAVVANTRGALVCKFFVALQYRIVTFWYVHLQRTTMHVCTRFLPFGFSGFVTFVNTKYPERIFDYRYCMYAILKTPEGTSRHRPVQR
jgi:hypothetical protein